MADSSSASDIQADNAVNAIADAFFAAFIRHDADALEGLYGPELMMSSPSGQRSGAEHLRLIREGAIAFDDLHYENVRRHVFENGFVQQHLVCCTLPSGAEMRKPACIVARLDGGRIVEFDQYFDPSHLRAEPMYQRLEARH